MLSLECYLEVAALQPNLLNLTNLNTSNQEVNNFNILDPVLLQWKNSNYALKLQETTVETFVNHILMHYNNVRHKTLTTTNSHEID